MSDPALTDKTPNKWTVMFFFAGDNTLSPLVVSQIKAIKDAGFQEDAEVLVHFDPNEKGAPTKIYNVYHKVKEALKAKKVKATRIGDENDPYVRNMIGDEIDPSTASKAMQKALDDPDAVSAAEALANFVDYCLENHQAHNYILFLIGHGMIVGNDNFLPDDLPVSAVTLIQLGKILEKFKGSARGKIEGTLQLLAMHSCSMSAAEVLYQLKGTAKYLLSSEGISFVGSWPYRQLLKKIFNTAKRRDGTDENVVRELIESLYYLSLYSATDFMLSGYSLDLSLCSLEEEKVGRLTEPIQQLVDALSKGLNDKLGRFVDLIVLSHWESQSYWQEDYTDLYDFCLCLQNRSRNKIEILEKELAQNDQADQAKSGVLDDLLKGVQKIHDACERIIEVLKVSGRNDWANRFDKLVVQSDNFGWKYQYSHGLSVYFPWSEPLDDKPVPKSPGDQQPVSRHAKGRSRGIIEKYREYAFTKEFEKSGNSWLSFLELYFEKTKRKSRAVEDSWTAERIQLSGNISEVLPLGATLGRESPIYGPGDKQSPIVGLACTCPSIKNYPTEMTRNGRRVRAFSISEGALQAFKQGPKPNLL